MIRPPDRTSLAGVPCRNCGSATLRVEWRLERVETGYSLAGVQTKFAMREWPYAVCGTCGAESRGKREAA